MRSALVAVTALAMAALISCLPSGLSGAQPAVRQPLKVLATTTQIQDFVRNVGGDRITVIPILQGDDDAHEYQPTAADARSVVDADLIFTNGIGLETWFDSLGRNARSGVPIVKLGEESGIGVRPGDEAESLGDPHVWFDSVNAQLMVNKIRDLLSTVDGAGQSTYDRNAASYSAQLDQMDREISAQWSAVPAEQRKLVTNHDAFGYYVSRYGITFVGSVIPSLSTDAEPSLSDTLRIAGAIREQNVRAIFTENSINPRLAESLSSLAGVRIYSNLYGDSLGKPGSDGDTYIKMMRFNTQTMIQGITG
jgi:ABC-type Zn uptake system ZnuABC Zn-binding protein ZnuA